MLSPSVLHLFEHNLVIAIIAIDEEVGINCVGYFAVTLVNVDEQTKRCSYFGLNEDRALVITSCGDGIK